MKRDPYETSDLYFAAYLRVASLPFLKAERRGDKMVFVFESRDPTVMRELKRQYFSDTAKVKALSFVQAVRHLKSLLRQGG